MVVVSVLYYFNIFGDFGKDATDLEAKIQSTQAELSKEKARLKETERIMKKAETLKGSVDSLNERFKIVSKQLPTKISTTEIMRVIDSLAKTSGVIVSEKEPGLPAKSGLLMQYPVRVSMRGGFSDLIMFIYYISNLEKVTRVSKFVISRPDTDLSPSKSSQINMNVTILGYEFIGGDTK
jgi:Tfp pilus assembly protein PilO